MKPRLVPGFLLRAPLLPVRALGRPGAALREHPLGPVALALASPDLAAGLARGGAAAERAADRYGRRAAFRPTPHGLLAGVMMGKLGATTAIETGPSRAHRTVPWGQLAALGRSLLDDPETRSHARVRVAPSLLMTGGEAVWLALPAGDGPLEARDAGLDELLAAVIEAASDWISWSEARVVAGGDGSDDDELDEYLSMLIDQGLLHFDLCPPLVGAPPLAWMRARLAAVATPAATAAGRALDEPERATLATLLHEGKATLSRAVVGRAAALAPLLFRLQEALAPPAAERALGPALLERLEVVAEVFGAGPFALAALATGAHGPVLATIEEEPPAGASPEPAVLGLLVEALTEAARAGTDVVELEPAALDAVLPPDAGPPSFELVLTPAAPGTDWLLGLHAPAGASWGRFAHALGAPMSAALAALSFADLGAVDVTYAASAALADLGTHPRVRAGALGLVSWSEEPALAARDLALSIDPSAPLALFARGHEVRPSPLHRVRSTTAPPGIYRLLAGWSLVRQHAPWAFGWGALAGLPRLPRVRLGGFVVAPASWRVPPAAGLKGKGLARWRASAAVPRQVQVGEGDELLLVDLDAPDAAEDLARHAGGRVFEIWPPLDRLADGAGRRVEAVVAVVREEEPARQRGEVVSPRPAPGWATFKLFGAEERQDDVLLSLSSLVGQAQSSGLIDRWHFLRYEQDTRAHLRLRVRGRSERAVDTFARRLRAHLEPLRDGGAVVALETAEYFPELVRYGGPRTFDVVEQLFELDSELVLRLLSVAAEAPEPLASDRLEWLVRGFDATARGLGLDPAARQALAARLRVAPADEEEGRVLDRDFRDRQRRLAALLTGTTADVCSAPLEAHVVRVQAIAGALAPAEIAALIEVLPSVLHLGAVRLLGARPDHERAAYVFWERTLEGVAARRRRGV